MRLRWAEGRETILHRQPITGGPMIARIGIVLGFLICLTACSPLGDWSAGPNACAPERVAEIPVRIVHGAALVPVRVDGTEAEMMLDTAASTLLSEEVAARLGLAEDTSRKTWITSIGGVTIARHVRVRSLEIGGQTSASLNLPVARAGHKFKEPPLFAGILGADQLSKFDIELNLPRGRVTFWRVAHCAGDFVRWNEPHYAIPLTRDYQNHMIAAARIDGHDVNAYVDWGASATTVLSWFSANLGITPEMLASEPLIASIGVDQKRLPTRVHRFETLQIGTEVIRGPRLLIANLSFHEVGMLLGLNFARGRRIWLSYATRQMFVAPPARRNEQRPPADASR